MPKVKQSKNVIDKQFVFNAEIIQDIFDKQSQGFSLPRHMNPWFKKQKGVRRTGVIYGWSQWELEEFTKCALDIHYFANTYCHIKSEDGQIRQMKLRPEQYKILDAYTKNRFTINFSSRQSGKCNLLISNVLAKTNDKIQVLPMFKILFRYKENKSVYDYVKYPLYWLLWKLNTG